MAEKFASSVQDKNNIDLSKNFALTFEHISKNDASGMFARLTRLSLSRTV